jgi:hypothetical protein
MGFHVISLLKIMPLKPEKKEAASEEPNFIRESAKGASKR